MRVQLTSSIWTLNERIKIQEMLEKEEMNKKTFSSIKTSKIQFENNKEMEKKQKMYNNNSLIKVTIIKGAKSNFYKN